MKPSNRPAVSGFTLVELLIVVVIIGILAAVAYPSYQRWTTETRRSDAHIALSQLANDLEKFYSECNGAYTTNITPTPRSCTAPATGTLGRGATGDRSPNSSYSLAIALPPTAGVPAGGYRITATPLGQQLANDKECTTLVLDSTGLRSATGSNTARCWRR